MINSTIEKYPLHKGSISLESYNQMADLYYSYVDNKPHNAYYERPATTSLIPDVNGKCVLDAGCAAGWYTKWLLERGAKVTAIDFSPRMIEMTQKRVGDKARVIQADLNNPMPFIKSNSMDVIVSSLSLHYLENWDHVLSEFYRILKQGGQFVLSVHHPFMDYTAYERDNYFLTERIDDVWTINDSQFEVQFYRRPLSAILNALTNADFIIEEVLEPMPTEHFKILHPKQYSRLTKSPLFLFMRVRKA